MSMPRRWLHAIGAITILLNGCVITGPGMLSLELMLHFGATIQAPAIYRMTYISEI